MFTPGTYLRKRREAAGISLEDVSGQVAARLQDIGVLGRDADHPRFVEFLTAVEGDRDNLSYFAALFMRHAFPFDVEAYWNLLLHRYDPDASDLPQPKLCRQCACSFHDACEVEGQPCAWSNTDPDLCTACERAGATQPEGATL